jgi:hypothetical protein
MPTASIPIHPLKKPIHPINFANLMTIRIKSLNKNFYCLGKIRDGFIQFGSVYYDCIDLNRKGESIQLVIPAATGSGKSVSATLYLSLIAKLGMSGLLVVSEVAVAIKAAETINDLAAKKVAGVFYSVNENNPKNKLLCSIDSLPKITVITHAMFIQRSDSGKAIKSLSRYKGKQRDLVIIDERIDLVKRVSFDTAEVADAMGILIRDSRLHKAVETTSSFNRNISKTRTNTAIKNTGDIKKFHTAVASVLEDLYTGLSKGQYNITQRMRGRKHNQELDRANVMDLIKRILFVISGDHARTVEGYKIVCHREEDLSCKFGSVVVLDATSRVNPEYEYRDANNHDIKVFDRIASRNYSKVKLNLCSLSGPKQSKYAIYSKPKKENKLKEKVIAYLKALGPIIKSGDKLLVATYKDLVPLFTEQNPYGDQLKFIHWGSKDARGSNEFKDFNKAMTVGWYRRPAHYYVASIMAINKIDSYVPTMGSAKFDATHLRNMLIIDDMLQFFNRIKCRTAIDKYGNCDPVELYCLTGGNQLIETKIRESFESEMPGIVIKEWKPKELKALKNKVTKIEERAENFVDWLMGKVGQFEEVTLAELLQDFGLNIKLVSKTINSDIFKNHLDDEGILMTKDKAWGSPVKFILPGCGV